MNRINDLRPNVKNPRKITDEKLKMMRESIIKFGDLSGFVFNVRTGNLVSGHQKQKITPEESEIFIEKKYEKPTMAGTIATGYVLINGERFSYRSVDWDEPTELAAMIAANKHGGEFDLGALEQIILDLDHANYDLDLTGFQRDELEQLFDWSDPSNAEIKEKEISDPSNAEIKEKEIDENIHTEKECPSCGYKWS